jgi:formylglycine-generating enzyme required for sulfatase activity/predicted Ser/Thr protein kinase
MMLAGRYKIVKDLGGGGFGKTYFAEDTQRPGNPICVVKQLKPQSNDPALLLIAQDLFKREAQTLYELGENDQIPRLYANFQQNNEFYLVQEYIKGNELSDEINPRRKWTQEQVIDLLLDVLKTLVIIHNHNVIHRDLKPANLIRREKDRKIVIIDFGAVKQIRTQVVNAQGQTSFTIAIGTPGYMPNEQSNNKPKLASDVYAIGMMAIQALTGLYPHQLPDDPRTGEIIWRDKAQVSDKFAAILDKMVRYDFRQRYPSAKEVLDVISRFKGDSLTRGEFLKWLGLGGVGVVTGIFIDSAFSKDTPQPALKSGGNQEPQSPIKNSEPSSSPSSTKIPLQTFSFETVKVNNQGSIISRQQSQAQYFTEDLGNGVSVEMVYIPGGTFTMGSPETEAESEGNEKPQHQVTIQPFYMGKYTVTQAQWKAVALLPKIKRDLNPDPSYFKGNNRPVERVSWYDAVEFCARLSQKTGCNYRLPSEAEWEYACRAGTRTPFHFGETITPDLANYNGNYTYANAPKGKYREETVDVGSFPPNAFGLYEMHGNVWEWCADPRHGNYNGAPTDGSVWDEKDNDNRYQKSADLLVMSRNDDKPRLLRGGSWDYLPRNSRSAIRFSYAPDTRLFNDGFRFLCVAAWTK